MKDWQRKYSKQFIIGMVAYAILLTVSLLLVGSERITNTILKIVVVLMPMLPLLYAMIAVVNNVRHQDELARRIHLEAVLITAFITGGVTFSYGLLEASQLVPPLPMTVVAPFMIIAWGITNAVISRHYG